MYKAIFLALLAVLAVGAAPALAQESAAPNVIRFQPPDTTTPNRRVGGVVRGAGDPLPAIINLAPARVGLTVARQPVLYWYLSGRSDYPIEISVIDGNTVEPLLEFRIKPPVEMGVHTIRLADYGLNLAPGRTFEWFVALVSNEDVRSEDVVSGAAIMHVAESRSLTARLAGVEPEERARIFAEEGLWYDVVDTLSEAIRRTPENLSLRAWRADLMEQVSLFSIGTYDRQFLEAGGN